MSYSAPRDLPLHAEIGKSCEGYSQFHLRLDSTFTADVPMKPDPSKYHPIICLAELYKLFMTCMSIPLDKDRILASEQRGCSSPKHECTEKPMVSQMQAKAKANAGHQAAFTVHCLDRF